MRWSTSASQACGSTSFNLAVSISVNIAAARSPPRSEPANNQARRPRAIPRNARSAALLVRQIRPSSRNRVKARPAPQHVIDGLGGVGVARQPGALGPHPALQCSNQRLDPFLSHSVPLLGPGTVDLALDGEDLVDAANRLDRQWHLPQIGQHEELAPAVGPARRFGDLAADFASPRTDSPNPA